jgi:rsbT co-antagonist protein RsbR
MAEALAGEVVAYAPHYRAMTPEERLERLSTNLGVFFDSLEERSGLTAWVESRTNTTVARGIDLGVTLQLLADYGRHFIDAALRAIDQGVYGAREGFRALMAALDTAERMFVQFHEARMRLFETLVDHSPDGIGVSSLDGKQIHPNPAFRALLGYGDELIGMHFSEYVVDDDPAVVQQLMEQGFWQGTSSYRRNDGSTLRCHSTIFLIPGPDGQPQAMGGVIRDISNQLRAEEELKRQADDLRTFYALAENAPDGVLVVGGDGTVSYANPAMCALLGYTESMAGAQMLDHVDAPEELVSEIGQQISGAGAWGGILSYRRRDGSSVRCQASSFLIRSADDDAGVIASIVRDLTSQQHAEQERIELQEQVIAAQQAALRELSTPLMPLAHGIVAMPLVGSVDSKRAQQIVEELLSGVAANRATTAIIDITGVPLVDTQVAGALIRAAQAVELLGARVVLTGIRPEVAQTLVGIGMSLGSIVTRGTLQDGIGYALHKQGQR